ncbi:Sodium/solute symporter [Penicillium occitanis (nom. inval.)]|nr:Sodium/solute symporter [Penicillium occitanis (nom. inval.)]PCH07989.1 hypothetical protein PENOC_016700 [Penicillium occitanis (nom. inval.)]
MILGAAGVISARTGMNIVASTFLLPLGVIVYTVAGGLKAIFLTDYVHTLIVMVTLAFLTIKAINNPAITGLSSFYDGSIFSIKSKSSIIFGLVHSFGDFALVIMDTSFWQKGFAADTAATMVGTTTGLAAIALEKSSTCPTYPRGKGGAWALLLVVFMCVTSTTSAELIAVSSIPSFDIYRTYINPKVQDHQVIRVSHWTVVVFGIFASAFASALQYGEIDLNWMGYFLATIICPGMFPLAFTILWKKQSTAAATITPLLGLASGIAVWLGSAYAYSGELTVISTEPQLPYLLGALTSTFSSAIYSIVITYIKPDNFDWTVFLLLSKVRVESDDDNSTNSPVNGVKDLDSVTHPYLPQELKRMNLAATLAAIFSAFFMG